MKRPHPSSSRKPRFRPGSAASLLLCTLLCTSLPTPPLRGQAMGLGSSDLAQAKFAGDSLFLLSRHGPLNRWRIPGGEFQGSLGGVDDWHLAVGFWTHDNLVTISEQGTLRTWSASSGEILAAHKIPDRVVLASVQPGVALWLTEAGDLFRFQGRSAQDELASTRLATRLSFSRAAFSADGSRLALLADPDRIQLLSTADGSQLESRQIPAEEEVRAIGFSPQNQLAALSRVRRTGVWRVRNGGPDRWRGSLTAELPSQNLDLMAYSRNGRWLALTGPTGAIHLLSTANPVEARLLNDHSGPVRVLLFDQNDSRLFSGGDDGRPRLWDTGSGKLLQRGRMELGSIRALSYLADPGLLAVARSHSPDGNGLSLWNLDSDRESSFVNPLRAGTAFDISSDLEWAATIDDDLSLRLFHLEDHLLRRSLLLSSRPRIVRFEPGRHRVAVGLEDGRILLTGIESGLIPSQIVASESPIRDLVFTGIGILAALDRAGNVAIWEVSSDLDAAQELGRESLGARSAPETQLWSEKGSLFALGPGPGGVRIRGLWPVRFDQEIPARDWLRIVPSFGRLAIVQAGAETICRYSMDEAGFSCTEAQSDGDTLALSNTAPEIRLRADSGGVLFVSTAPDRSPLALSHPAAVHWELSSSPSSVFRLDQARLGSLDIRAGESCGSAEDGLCRTSPGFLVVHLSGGGLEGSTRLTELGQPSLIGSSRPELPAGLARLANSRTITIPIRGEIDLAAGDLISIRGLSAAGNPRIVGRAKHHEPRWDPASGEWQNQEFLLALFEYPELSEPILAHLSVIPQAAGSSVGGTVRLAVPADSRQESQPDETTRQKPEGNADRKSGSGARP